MALSEREQQVLRDLEAQLNQEDPNLASSMEQVEKRLDRTVRFSPRHVGGGVSMVLVGLAVVIGGVAVGHGVVSIGLGVLGFGLAVWGVMVALTRVDAQGRAGGKAGAPGAGAPDGAGGSQVGKGRSGFMDRQAERWDRRRESRG